MAQSPKDIRRSLDRYLGPDFRGRLRARGIARGIVWTDGVVPEGSPPFPEALTADLLDFGYVLLALALELRDANSIRSREERFETADAFEVAAEAVESAVRRGNPNDGDQGRHLVVAAAAFHLAGYAARSFSLLPAAALAKNLASCERALAYLLRRDLLDLRSFIVDWLARNDHSDEAVAARIEDEDEEFGPEDAVVLALTTTYLRALGLADTALLTGDGRRYKAAVTMLRELIGGASGVGNIPVWWVATLTAHLLGDLWDQCLHNQLPYGPGGNLPERWNDLRRDFIAQLAVRRPPHVDLWPSQLEAARRSVDPEDDLVIALPTSAGKTKIAELCILRTLADEKRAVYVTPLRALSAQVERVLARTFVPLGATVTALYGAIGSSSVDEQTLINADVVVATPEKLDFALRQDPHVLDDVALVVLDEGHMIGLGSREIRYEALIQRLLRRRDANERRIVCLSAMFNPSDIYFKDFGAWLRHDAQGDPVHVEWRPTRRRLAHLDWFAPSGTARLAFLEGEEAFVPRFIDREPPLGGKRTKFFPADDKEFCLSAANAFARDGHAVLIYSPQRSQIDPLVRKFVQVRKQGYLTHVKAPSPEHLATAMAIGREWLGAEHTAVEALQIGVGTHHGALPRPFQSAIEDLLEKKRLPIVVASPTLAQGVDLSCSVLVFRSLTRFDPETKRHAPIRPAEFANVVGRAGRAYVDLDGIVVLPSFEAAKRAAQHEMFDKLVAESRSQRLVSGLARLVWELAERISQKLGVDESKLVEYVLNNDALWSDARLAVPENIEEDEDESVRTLDEYVADLDVAILSLVELDTPVDQLAGVLDDVLKDSLWRRTLAHQNQDVRSLERELFVSRARWLWAQTNPEQRKACFAAGLGVRSGTFLFDQLDGLVDVLADLQGAIRRADTAQIAELAIRLAERVTADFFFSIRKPPKNWTAVLTKWVTGTAFGEILDGLGVREEQRTQSFIQDGVVFKLVWAVEAVRVQAATSGHARAEELGDGPMLVLTHGVPTVQAALLCQTGYASRTGAIWVTGQLPAAFTDLDGLRAWVRENEPSLSRDDFWESADHRLLWGHLSTPNVGGHPRKWSWRTMTVVPGWRVKAPPAGSFVRLVPQTGRSALVCNDTLETLGTVTLPMDPSGAVLHANVLEAGGLRVAYFGPKA